jgi:hypothetical protein
MSLTEAREQRIFLTIEAESPGFSKYAKAIGVLRLHRKFAKRTFHSAQDDSYSGMFSFHTLLQAEGGNKNQATIRIQMLLNFDRHQIPIRFPAGFIVRNNRTVRPIAGELVRANQQQ